MCDVHFEDGVDIDEVSTLTAGNDITTFHVDNVKCGVAICHDVSFDEFIKIYGKVGESKLKGKKEQICISVANFLDYMQVAI